MLCLAESSDLVLFESMQNQSWLLIQNAGNGSIFFMICRTEVAFDCGNQWNLCAKIPRNVVCLDKMVWHGLVCGKVLFLLFFNVYVFVLYLCYVIRNINVLQKNNVH